ncbi:hypothetical protein FB45DRAFT_1019305 [Roridomyces roridus]|uniref:Uncharacterized protein n=1 Tax=Roridomyces roridus TaxID=1738132 RepID=A0AAD7CF35_9AGAR|nr:hypothetical protein FB45DRAFT_1019305 [Roridomyces roridus]
MLRNKRRGESLDSRCLTPSKPRRVEMLAAGTEDARPQEETSVVVASTGKLLPSASHTYSSSDTRSPRSSRLARRSLASIATRWTKDAGWEDKG